MVTRPDRRVRRTRIALRDALLDLMAERDYEGVTVQDIIDRADVGRSTFYNHYTDKQHLLRDGFADLRAIVARPTAGAGRLRFSLPLLRHVSEQRRLVRALLSADDRAPLRRQVEAVLVDVVRDELAGRPGVAARTALVEAAARYAVGAYLGLMQWWLTDRPEMSPEEADRLFHALVEPGLRACLPPA